MRRTASRGESKHVDRYQSRTRGGEKCKFTVLRTSLTIQLTHVVPPACHCFVNIQFPRNRGPDAGKWKNTEIVGADKPRKRITAPQRKFQAFCIPFRGLSLENRSTRDRYSSLESTPVAEELSDRWRWCSEPWHRTISKSNREIEGSASQNL